MTQSLTIRRPDDWHLHLRDGAMMRAVLPETARHFARAIVMPNLVPPVVTAAQAAAYRDRILAALPDGSTTDIALLTRSLIAVVHGHCSLAVTGSFALMGVDDPLGCALARVREILSAHGYRTSQ